MINHAVQQWEGWNFYANLPEKEFYAFRETGYAGELLKTLDKTFPALCKAYDVLLYFQLAHDLPVWKIDDFKKPLILFVAGHEAPGLPADVISKAVFIFKQYLDPKLTQTYPHVFRIPVGPSSVFPATPVVDFNQRTCGVFFAGNLHKGRRKLFRQLSGLQLLPFPVLYRIRKYLTKDFSSRLPASVISFSGRFHSGFTSADYACRIANAKIVLCPYGVDDKETMRHFEAAKQGCVIVSDSMPDAWYFRNAPFVIIKDWKSIYKELESLLQNTGLLYQKHIDTCRWWQDVCSPDAVSRFVISKVQHVESGSLINKTDLPGDIRLID